MKRYPEATKEDFICECGGEFHPTMTVYTSIPPMMGFRCNKCKKEKLFVDGDYSMDIPTGRSEHGKESWKAK